MTLHTKLLEIQNLGLKFGKTASNPFYKSKYLTLDHLLDKLLPELNKLEILVWHYTENNEVVTAISDWETVMTSKFPIGNVSDPQKIGSAITYAKRYNLWQLFNIVTDDDDDGNKASIATDTKDTFNKPNFWKRNMDNLKSAIEKWERKKNKEETLAYLEATYNLKDDARGWTEEYFDRLPKKEIPDEVGTTVDEAYNDKDPRDLHTKILASNSYDN